MFPDHMKLAKMAVAFIAVHVAAQEQLAWSNANTILEC